VRIAFVQTYPIYHDGVDTADWLSINGREVEMASHLARSGNELEFWAVGVRPSVVDIPGQGEALFPLRIFPPRHFRGRTRNHASPALLSRARSFRADLHVLKGTNGGVGIHLLREYAVPAEAAFAFILGGGHYSRFVPRARCVFYQTELQRGWLERPAARPWRRPVPAERLVFLPKTVDTGLFSPDPDAAKEWDILVACRLIDRLKNLGVLVPLARRFRVAVAGSGPDEDRLRKKIPQATWLGRIPHAELPRALRASRLFMHTGVRELVPRVLTEAMACGIPAVAFAGPITPEVVPPGCGILVPGRDFVRPIAALLEDEESRRSLGRMAREHAVAHLSPACIKAPLDEMLRRIGR
jgi:glycosyltransferase involved in cell wall biosynthesis